MKKQKVKYKEISGITLIALVVTIIVLLILAGISIGMISGNNGILNRAREAKEKTDISKEKESIQTAVVHAMEKNKFGELTKAELENELEYSDGIVIKIGEIFKVGFSNEREYFIDKEGNVKQKKSNEVDINDICSEVSTYLSCDILNYTPALQSLRIYRVAIALCRENWGHK